LSDKKSGKLKATGNPLENTIWEEFGTGECAERRWCTWCTPIFIQFMNSCLKRALSFESLFDNNIFNAFFILPDDKSLKSPKESVSIQQPSHENPHKIFGFLNGTLSLLSNTGYFSIPNISSFQYDLFRSKKAFFRPLDGRKLNKTCVYVGTKFTRSPHWGQENPV